MSFSIFGQVQYAYKDIDATVTVDHWEDQITCVGKDCADKDLVVRKENTCGDLKKWADKDDYREGLQAVKDYNQWYFKASCPAPKATMAMLTLCLVSLIGGVFTSILCAFDQMNALIGGIFSLVAWLWMFLGVTVYGAMTHATAKKSYWQDGSIALQWGWALPCTAMFFLLISGVLLMVDWKLNGPPGGNGGGKQQV
eukprot:CAMPEP_0117034738 /NCGR_PEP_ID=MMETSP0472-20121206/24714_1 /TAXON_ID=693140 ORGANISM="Tiarina fusus, Strain LIS" /NCGR_SAMPLE_ID=MMETSP0472 /ASSEMBLY_ACC=CAM_ASM_000603 /LENGTH=196 /DNA_ID=CAMNT_0004743999 /DNA_START=155 /DNA_END=745 /DNA_ORIENTATION=+